MIMPGKCICPRCGKVTDTAFYTAANMRIGAVLHKTDRGGYILKSMQPGDAVSTDNADVSYLLEENFDLAGAPLPHTLKARYKQGNRVVTMKRSCPFCERSGKRTVFENELNGRVPIFVVAAIGPPFSGKTAWLGALSGDALNPLNRQRYAYKVRPRLLKDRSEQGGSTSENDSSGNSNYFLIMKKTPSGNDAVAAMLYFLDNPGENFSMERLMRDDSALNEFLGLIDAAVFFDPAVKTKDNTPSPEKRLASSEIYNRLQNKLTKIPVAYICTFADLLPKQDPPLFQEGLFPNATYGLSSEAARDLFLPQAIGDRIALQNQLVTDGVHTSTAFRMMECRSRCAFLVQSCVSEKAQTSSTIVDQNNYEQQFNVADPLLWLLAELKLFPFVLQEGAST